MNFSFIIIFISVILALWIITFLYFKWYIKQRTSESGVLKETRQEVRNMLNQVTLSLVEINGATDRNIQLIEDRILKLKELLEDTDKRISVYVKEVEKSKTSEALYTQLGRGVRAAIHNTPPSLPAPPLSSVRPELPLVNEQNTAESSLQKTPKKETVQKPPSKKEIRAQIDQLAGEGLSAKEIALKLDISIAEAELAMQLRRRQVKAPE